MRFFFFPCSGYNDFRPADSSAFRVHMAENPILKSDYKIF